MKFFGCNEKENRIHLLRLLLIYQKYEDVLKEGSIGEVFKFFQKSKIINTINHNAMVKKIHYL
jgi:hypothetical protein